MKLKSHSKVQNPHASTQSIRANSHSLNQHDPAVAPTHKEIGQRAYFCYLNEGKEAGHDVHHWLEAKADLNAQYNFDRHQGFKQRA